MKKFFYIGWIAFICFGQLGYSQNSRVIENLDSKSYHKVETSPGLQISKIEGKMEGVNSYAIHQGIRNRASATVSNYNLKVHVEGGNNWTLVIGNGLDWEEDDYFFDFVMSFMVADNTYEATLPEGYYDITIKDNVPDLMDPIFFFFEQVFIGEDTELTANLEDAVHRVDIAPVDINNVSLLDREMDFVDTEITYSLHMHSSIRMVFLDSYMAFEGFFPDLCLYVNDMGTRNRIMVTVDAYEPATGDSYFLTMPLIDNGITGDIVLENQSEEIVHYSQMFNISKELTADSYSHKRFLEVDYDFEGKYGHGWVSSSSWSLDRVHDRDKPYSLYTNVTYQDAPQTGDLRFFIGPLFYEFFDIYGQTDYEGVVAGQYMAINKNGELIQNFHSDPFFDWAFCDRENLIDIMGNSPLSKVWNEEEFYNEGYRTPHLYYQARNFNAASHPNNTSTINSAMTFMGEFNEQKSNHGDVLVKITGDGMEIFNDSIFLFNQASDLDAYRSQYQIELTNDQVFAYGKKMINRTNIDFDLTKSDANPPALTMLRVIDQEKISMFVHGTTGRLEITAGDFTINFDRWQTKYEKEATIEVSWSSDGTTFHELPAIEDASKFHPSYGNFYNVSLASLADIGLAEEWITIKIVLTDDAGNSIVQILDPLFQYMGDTGIEDFFAKQTSCVAYPNPFTGNVNIELNDPVSGATYFEIYDITGRIIHQQKIDCSQTGTFTWNGSHLKEGVYFYGIYNQGNAITGKIIKQ